jgi:hypothetical protein
VSTREDSLTRTTLRLGTGTAPFAIEQVIRALQRVPGVLTVEPDAGGATALVAHDAAVPLNSLVAAASVAGAAAKIVGEMQRLPASSAAVLLPKSMSRQYLTAVAVAAIVAVIFMDLAFPSNAEKRWIFLVPLALVWAFALVRGTAGPRR